MDMFRVRSAKPLSARSQQGAALITALLLLVVMTILALSVMQMSRVEERMAGNTRDLNVAFEAAEAAARNGEVAVRQQATAIDCSPSATCKSWIQGSPPDLANQTADWWSSNAIPFADPALHPMSGVKNNPTYVVEHLGFVRTDGGVETGVLPAGRDFYEVTGHSTGVSGLANSVVQTTFARKFN
jgi:type IV pilus assembly protein PilX